MSNNSNKFGRAYEYAWFLTIKQVLNNYSLEIENNKYINNLEILWELLDNKNKKLLLASASSAFKMISYLEPLIMKTKENIKLSFADDRNGITGDVRDLIIYLSKHNRTIGISLKHNNDSAKHSRISPRLNFGKS